MKAGFVGLVGLPNAGKSSLVNALVGEKVSIVSSKPQTTRRRVTGVLTTEDTQIVFIDAPGFIQKVHGGVHQYLIDELQDVVANSEVLVLVLSSGEPAHIQLEVLRLVKASGIPYLILWNKCDVAKPTEKELEHLELTPENLHYVSALDSSTVWKTHLLDAVKAVLPETSQQLFDSELFTTQTIRDMASEIIREKVFHSVHQEVPFGVAVQVRKFEELGKLTRIHADLWADRESHKGILIGKSGVMLKEIGTKARQDLEKLLSTKVFLELHVTVKPNWAADGRSMKELGYVIDKR